MLKPSDIQKYTILLWQDVYASTDWLFSNKTIIQEMEDGEERQIFLDPYDEALDSLDRMAAKYFDLVVMIGANGTCQVQSIIFRTKEGYDRYKEDGVLIFNQPE